MGDMLTLYRDEQLVLQLDKSEATARMQFAYVQRMDNEMDKGIELHGEGIRSPNQSQRNHFVIARILDAMAVNDQRAMTMYCRYLIHRAPQLDAIRVQEDGDEYAIDLVYS